ncbi:nuclear receptor subfamily 1 group I member 3 isoform X1 [Manis javanica]|uniref:nuclear receptor subfamily 1 group I member 3 isoform X1 n=2 Tax=Manis javanica TaxID=9974 RepID=UPI00081336B3|nr:nuclear receptor subfamily 1 group I member 3 isoform X1 [Manis javanica]KAI5940668.1 Nuclear receptor subfamily 1 group I member 3 [Manis javanica]
MPATTTMGMLGRPPTQAFALGSESVPYLNRHCEQLEATHTTEGSVFQGPVTATTFEAMVSGDDEQRHCVVCGDRATGYHFHALTCEGCKGFFRRTASKSTCLTCPFAGSCTVTKAQRRHCQACRLQKCLDAGMRKDMILSAEALALRRARQARRRAQCAPMLLSKEQKELVRTLLGAHTRHMGAMFDQFVQFRPPAHLFIHHQPLATLAPGLPLLMHFADINTFMVQQIIKFTKDLPLFRSLPMEDQISLLKGAAVEICHIALNTTFCLQTHNFFCGPLRYTIEDGVHVGFQEEFLELLFHFHGTLRRLHLQEPEYVLMAAMALFSPDRPGVTRREQIDQLQEEMALTLQSYIKKQRPRPQDRFLYAKLLGLLAELRSINNAYGYQIQHVRGLSAMMPLLQEICS